MSTNEKTAKKLITTLLPMAGNVVGGYSKEGRDLFNIGKRIRISSVLYLTLVALVLPSAAQTTLISDTFEADLGSWTATSDAGLYTWAGAPDVNYATIGSGAAYIFRSYSNPDVITLTDPLPLDTQGYTSVTISFDHIWETGSATVRWKVQYSSDGGTNWSNLGDASATLSGATYSKTLNEGSYSFTDNALFRIGFDGTGNTQKGYADNILITGLPVYVPPPPAGTVITIR